MLKTKIKKEQNKSYSRFAGILCLIMSIFFAALLVLPVENSFLEFAAKFQLYLLGKGAFLLPIFLLYLAWQLLWIGRVQILNKNTIASILLLLCFVCTAHHIFIPEGEELHPTTLLDGGGLVGGIFSLGVRWAAGMDGTYIVLAVAWIIGLWLLLPLHAIRHCLKGILFGSKDESKKKETSITEVNKKQVELQKPVTNDTVLQTNKNKNIYKNPEFGAFTEGLQKESAFRRILNFNKENIYKKDPVKQEVEKDPIQVPVWQKEDKKPKVILRPIINYGNEATIMPEHRFLGGKTVSDVKQSVPPFLTNAVLEPKVNASHPIINNIYRTQHEEILTNNPIGKKSGGITIVDIENKEPPVDENITLTSVNPKDITEKVDNAVQRQSGYILPPVELLDLPLIIDPSSYEKDIMEQCSILERTLADFKVRAKVIAVTRGPSVTRFELEPAPGVKVSSVVNLADDIALRLAASGVRIEAPIPGKSAIGIEAPNRKNNTVCLREVVTDNKVKEASSRICIGLGKDISGNVVTADLSKMPHLLVAGSTGSGKSVCINTIIAGILYKARPDEVKLILVDPKVVELSNYNGIPHLLTPVVTEPKKAASALHWAVVEMERRYKLFFNSHVREIKSYNNKAQDKLPYIIIIIDELSDLMMVAKVDVESAIKRLAQKARAAGIHLILATQRPSVDVITGTLKANIPSRIAFAVSSQTDSRTIIDVGGAEKLLGKGDMLFCPIGQNKPLRVQGAFVTDAELNKIVDFIKKQSIPVEYEEDVTNQELECDNKGNHNHEENNSATTAEDELFKDALELVLDMGQASSSMLQRRFRIGYTRAARLVDTMEELGIVGQSVGSKPREVIMSRQEAEERFLKPD